MSRASDLANVIASGSTSIVAEGTNTTNLQQGLAKAWCTWNMNNENIVSDSFNVSSMSDDATGVNRFNFTSYMTNAVYAVTSCFYESTNSNTNVLRVENTTAPVTSSVKMEGGEYQAGGTNVNRDLELAYTVIHGDLT